LAVVLALYKEMGREGNPISHPDSPGFTNLAFNMNKIDQEKNLTKNVLECV
jgi:hypothetical protein